MPGINDNPFTAQGRQSIAATKAAAQPIAAPQQQSAGGIDPTVKALTSAIGAAETGASSPAAYSKRGASGEYGRYQFMPDTWNAYAKEAGVNSPLEGASIEEQNKVAYNKISQWKAQGYNPAQIASMWNAGPGKPNAYAENFRGTNSKGVSYDTPAYARKVSQEYQRLKQATGIGTEAQGQPSFIQDVADTGSKTLQGVSDAFHKGLTGGPLGIVNGLIQGAGAVAGGIGGLTNNVLEHTPVVGDVYKGAENLIGEGVSAAANTDVGKSVIGGAQEFAQNHPEISKDLGALVNVAGVLPIGKGLMVAKNAAKEGVTSALVGSAEKAAAKAVGSDAVKLADVKKGIKQGLITDGKRGPQLAADRSQALSQKYLADEMRSGALSKKASPSQIAVHAEDAADAEAKNLEKMLKEQEVQNVLQPEDLQQLYKNTLDRAGDSITSGETPAKTLFGVFEKNLPKSGDITAYDVLKARRAVGSFVRSNRGDWSQRGVLTGFKSARDAIWDESKDLLVKMAPNVDVLPSLEKQSSLYRVSDYIAPKVKKEINEAAKSTFLRRHPVIRGLVRAGSRAAIEGTGVGAALHIMGD